MGVDIFIAVEYRKPDGTWRRAEPLVPTPEVVFLGEYEDYLAFPGSSEVRLPPSLRQPYVPDMWDFDVMNRWLARIAHRVGRPASPDDLLPATWEILRHLDSEEQIHVVSLKELEALPWPGGWVENERYFEETQRTREHLLSRLRSLGKGEEVRLGYVWNV